MGTAPGPAALGFGTRSCPGTPSRACFLGCRHCVSTSIPGSSGFPTSDVGGCKCHPRQRPAVVGCWGEQQMTIHQGSRHWTTPGTHSLRGRGPSCLTDSEGSACGQLSAGSKQKQHGERGSVGQLFAPGQPGGRGRRAQSGTRTRPPGHTPVTSTHRCPLEPSAMNVSMAEQLMSTAALRERHSELRRRGGRGGPKAPQRCKQLRVMGGKQSTVSVTPGLLHPRPGCPRLGGAAGHKGEERDPLNFLAYPGAPCHFRVLGSG